MGKVMMEIGRLERSSGVHTLEWVHHSSIIDVWPQLVEELLDNVDLWKFHNTLPNILRRLVDTEMQLHVVKKDGAICCFCITEFVNYPPGTTDMIVYWVSGSAYKEYLELLNALERWGAQKGAQRIQATGRPGWSRSLKALGYKEEKISLCKSLDRRMN